MAIHKSGLWVPLESERQDQAEEDNRKKLEECRRPARPYISACPQCKCKVVCHCSECQQTVTGCACTLKEKVDNLRADAMDKLHG
jgi:hypothetical protein